jgi:outer membrane protein TolC
MDFSDFLDLLIISHMRFLFVSSACAAMLVCAPAWAQAPVSVDLHDALARARAYSPQFLASTTGVGLAEQDRVQAKGALLPSLSNFSQYIYTQGNGTPSGVFVSNDGVHIYNQQAVVHADLYSASKLAEYRRTIAAETLARARRDVALRGLSSVVVQYYYAVVTAQRRLENARESVQEARVFQDITEAQERGGEVAHTDVLQAQLQFQQRQREQRDAETALTQAKLALSVMLFPDINQPYDVVDDLRPDAPVPEKSQTQARAFMNNPELQAAEAGVREAGFGIKVNRGAYLPTVSLDYFYGINANVFGIHGPDGRQNLGSVVQGTLTLPVWNWGINRSRVRQAELLQRQAQTDLTLAQRQIQADVESFSVEALGARTQLDSLQASLDLATESVRLTLLRYQAGESTALEVVNAQSMLVAARNAYGDGLARYRLSLANIEVLTGTL